MPAKKNKRRPTRPLRSAPTRKLPAFVTPMAAQVVKRLPEGDDWIYELKFDGYRALIIKDEQRVELRSRKNKDLTGMYPGIAAAGLRWRRRGIFCPRCFSPRATLTGGMPFRVAAASSGAEAQRRGHAPGFCLCELVIVLMRGAEDNHGATTVA